MAMMQICTIFTRRALTISTNPATHQRNGFSSLSPAISSFELCGRGDKRTKKGKRFRGSYGKCRPRKDKIIERLKDKLEVPRSTPWPLPFKLI